MLINHVSIVNKQGFQLRLTVNPLNRWSESFRPIGVQVASDLAYNAHIK